MSLTNLMYYLSNYNINTKLYGYPWYHIYSIPALLYYVLPTVWWHPRGISYLRQLFISKLAAVPGGGKILSTTTVCYSSHVHLNHHDQSASPFNCAIHATQITSLPSALRCKPPRSKYLMSSLHCFTETHNTLFSNLLNPPLFEADLTDSDRKSVV